MRLDREAAYRSQYLNRPNVRSVLLQDLCPFGISEQVAIGFIDFIAFHEVACAPAPARTTPTACASVAG